MHAQDFDAVRRTGLCELRTAMLGAFPEGAVLRLEEDCPPELDVYAWWRVSSADGHEAVNSLSFRLSSAMVAAYLQLPAAERPDRCARLRAWIAWTIDGGPRVSDRDEDFDISAVVPLNVFWPDRPPAI